MLRGLRAWFTKQMIGLQAMPIQISKFLTF
jgi:hypothetical protein